MSNSLSVPVYNRNSADARDILTRVPSDDIGQESVQCTLKFHVRDAYWKEQKLPNGLHRPYLELNGSVQEMFIEEDDDRTFMCGSKSITMDEPQDVRVSWILSTNELANLTQKGLFYDDFAMPAGLIDGEIEIPGEIVYTCVYDTPVTMVSIARPWEVETSSKANHYDTIFELWEVSEQRAREEHKDFAYSLDAFAPSIAPAPESPIRDYFDDDVPKGSQETYIPQNLDEEEALIKSFNDTIQEREAEAVRNRQLAEDKAQKRRIALNHIRAAHKDSAMAEARAKNAQKDLYEQLMSGNTEDTDGNSGKLKYDDIKNGVQSDAYSSIMNDMLSEARKAEGSYIDGDGNDSKSDADAKKSRDAARLVDIARDNQALNAGVTDISGFGAADETGNESQMSDEEKKEMQEKRSREAARRVDIALDNQALNRGETDIAGQGAGHSKSQAEKTAAARNALASLLGGSKSAQPEQQDPDYNGYI